MRACCAAQRLRHAAVEKAEAQKVAVVKAAEAEAEAKHLQGVGMARQRQAIINGLRNSMSDFALLDGINNRDALELMLMTQVGVYTYRYAGMHMCM
jgi:hypothetical protein